MTEGEVRPASPAMLTSQTCDVIANSNGLTSTDFIAMNAGVGADCTTLWAGSYVWCVGLGKLV